MASHTAMRGSKKKVTVKKASGKYKTVINDLPKPRKRPLAREPNLSDNDIAVAMASSFDTFVIFDLDGCISDDAWRFDFVQERENNDERWAHYHGSLHLDAPLLHGGELLMRCVASNLYPIFITARPNAFRAATARWLESNFGLIANKTASLLMRDDNCPLPTVHVKQTLLADLLADIDASSIVAAYDDREDIVTMYNSVFGINAYVLDKNGVSDPLNLQSYRTRHLAPEPALGSVAASMDKAVAGTQSALRHDTLGELLDDQRRKFADVVFADMPVHPVSNALIDAVSTLEDRMVKYGRADLMAGDVAAALFPKGLELGGNSSSMRMGMMMFHVIGKLSRFASSGMKNTDSVHDLINYSGFMDAIMTERASADACAGQTGPTNPTKFL